MIVCPHGVDTEIKIKTVIVEDEVVTYFDGQQCFECLLDRIGRVVVLMPVTAMRPAVEKV